VKGLGQSNVAPEINNNQCYLTLARGTLKPECNLTYM
jgi:hypothetical protein